MKKVFIKETNSVFVTTKSDLEISNSVFVNKKMKDNMFEYVYYLFLIIIALYGIYSFIKFKLISDMFLLNSFKYYNLNESPIIFYLNVLSCSLFIGLTINFINSFKRKKEVK